MNRLCLGPLLSIGLLALLPACDHAPASRPAADAPGTAAPQASLTSATPAPSKDDATSPSRGSIHIDDRIVKACGNLPEPHFAFDSAAIRDQAADSLRSVASCFVDGALKGRTVKLVGRADNRGSAMYNISLGQDRAASVSRFLRASGMPRAQVKSMSRGAFDATGTDDDGWARDRRVDILLAD